MKYHGSFISSRRACADLTGTKDQGGALQGGDGCLQDPVRATIPAGVQERPVRTPLWDWQRCCVFSLCVCCLVLIVQSRLQAREEAAEEERARRGEEGEEGNEEAGPPARRSQEDPLRAGAGQAEKAYAHAPSSLSGLPFTPTSLTRNPRTSVLADAALPLPGPRHERQGRRSEEVQLSLSPFRSPSFFDSAEAVALTPVRDPVLCRYFNFIATHSEKEIYDRLYPEFFGDTREHVENLVPHKRKSLPPPPRSTCRQRSEAFESQKPEWGS